MSNNHSLMLRWAGLTLFLFVLGCEMPEPVDLTGTWKSVGEDPVPVKLVFRKDGTFFRSRDFGGYEWRTAGRYRVESRHIVFERMVEGFVGRGGSELDAVLKAPYTVEGTQLVLFPGASGEERFVQIE
jgi:hypothetical protein